MMSKEELAVIDLLNGNAIDCEGLDWRQVYDIACRQGVGAVVFDEVQQRHSEIHPFEQDSDFLFEWYLYVLQTERRSVCVNKVLCKLVQLLSYSQVPYVLLKGQGLAAFYPKPLHRVTGDIDLYVGRDGYHKACAMILDNGWMDGKGCHEDIKHFCFSVNGIPIELHYSSALIPGSTCNRRFQEWMEAALKTPEVGFFINDKGEFGAEGDSPIRTLPALENCVFTFVHLFGHFIGGSASLRQLQDWACLLRRLDADEDELQHRLNDIGFMKAWQTFGCLLTRYFGFERSDVPCYNSCYESRSEKIMSAIMRSGCKDGQSYRYMSKWMKCWAGYWRFLTGYTSVFGMFPIESMKYLTRVLQNTCVKYLNLMHGRIHH